MIYQQEFFYFFLAFVLTVLIGFRLTQFLHQYFSLTHALMVMLAIVLNPLSIDAIVAPNPLMGSLSFYLFLEAFMLHKKDKIKSAMAISFAAALLNIGLCLVPLYFFYLHRKKLKHLSVLPFIYSYFLIIYLWKHILISIHNPILFFGHFITNLIAPLSLSVFDYSILPFFWSLPLLSFIVVLIIIWREKTDDRSREFLPFLFFPVIGSVFQQWAFPYRFWDEVVQTNSNFLVLTFAFIMIMAIHLPKRVFALYLTFVLIMSFLWAEEWFPNSNIIRKSIINLPESYPLRSETKRLLAWQLIYENKTSEGAELLKALSEKHPDDQALKADLKNVESINK